MMTAHYSLSEALIVVIALWCIARYAGTGLWLAALGTALLGLAAGIGTFRFASGMVEELGELHRTTSQLGGAAAMVLIAIQLMLLVPATRTGGAKAGVAVLAALSAAALLFAPQYATALFILWLLAAIIGSAMLPADRLASRLVRAGVVAIFLVDLLLVRQSPALGPDLSWHLFHVLIAVWLYGMCRILLSAQADEAVPTRPPRP